MGPQVHSVKQIIGRYFHDATVQQVLDGGSWAFHVAPGPLGECRIQGAAPPQQEASATLAGCWLSAAETI